MLLTRKWLVLPLAAVALLLLVDTRESQAQGIRVQIGGFGINAGGAYCGPSVYRGGHHFYSNQPRVYSYSAQRPIYGYNQFGSPYGIYGGHHGVHYRGYHDTTHFDYHPPQIYRHGNHYDFLPGHYDLHRSGHYHH